MKNEGGKRTGCCFFRGRVGENVKIQKICLDRRRAICFLLNVIQALNETIIYRKGKGGCGCDRCWKASAEEPRDARGDGDRCWFRAHYSGRNAAAHAALRRKERPRNALHRCAVHRDERDLRHRSGHGRYGGALVAFRQMRHSPAHPDRRSRLYVGHDGDVAAAAAHDHTARAHGHRSRLRSGFRAAASCG